MKKWYVMSGMGVVLVVIVLVWQVNRCEVCDATNYPPEGNTIVVFGDSLVEGVGSGQGGGFVTVLEERLGVQVVNLGVSGNTTAQALARVDEAVNEEPDISIVVLGGNDVLRKIPQEETFDNLKEIITELQREGSIVIMVGVRTGIFSSQYNDAYEALAKETGALYLEDALKGLFGKPKFMADPIHPNDAGYTRLADRLEPMLRELLHEE